VPLVVALHGGLQPAERLAASTGLASDGPAQGFAVAFPEGFRRAWNAGRCCGGAARLRIDDVGFVTAIIDRAIGEHGVDPTRVFVTGISNGGHLAYRLAVERSDRIAAIAPVAASLVCDGRPGEPVSLLHIHGTGDRFVPFGGGIGARSLDPTDYAPAREMVDRWRTWMGCSAAAVVTRTAAVTTETWSGPAGVEVALTTIDGGGHLWPGARVGATVRRAADFDATTAMLDFFARHGPSTP